MVNSIRAELYKLTHRAYFYGFNLCCAAFALLVVGCIAARGILSIFGGVDSAIDSSVDAGKSFIGGALSAGQNFLNTLMGL